MAFINIPLYTNLSDFEAPTEIKILSDGLQEIAKRSEKIFDAISESAGLIDHVLDVGLKAYDYADYLAPGCLNGFDLEGIKVSKESITFTISDIDGAEALFSIELSEVNELELVKKKSEPTNTSMVESCEEDNASSDSEEWLETLLSCHKTLDLPSINDKELKNAKEVISSLEPLLKSYYNYELLNFIENGEDWFLQEIPIIGKKLICPISAILAFWLIGKRKRHTSTAKHWPFVVTELAPIYCIFGVSPPDTVNC